ncbi:MAG: polyketide synthase dehydratase domain-containing protein, partial [Pseudomonadota bacterium]
MKKGELYALTEALDLQYGPHFRCVDSVATLDDRTVVAELSHPGDPLEGERPTDHGLAFHPGLLDGAFQAALALLARRDGDAGTFVPQGAETIHFFGNEASARRVLITLHHASEESVVADITMFDADGTPLIAIERLRLMPMPSAGRPTIDRHTLLAPQWMPISEPLVPEMAALGEPQTSPLDDLTLRILSNGLREVGKSCGLADGHFSLDLALDRELISEANAEVTASLLVELEFEPTEEDGVLSLSSVDTIETLEAAWREASATWPERGAELSLLAHRIHELPAILAGDENAIAAEAPLTEALRRTGLDHGLGARLAATVAASLPGNPMRLRLRFVGARMAAIMGETLGTLRRMRPDQPIDVQVLAQDGEALVRAQNDLAGFSGVTIVLPDELDTLPPADVVVCMPDFVAADGEDHASRDLAAEFSGCPVGTLVIDAGLADNLVSDFLLGLNGDAPAAHDASIWQLK